MRGAREHGSEYILELHIEICAMEIYDCKIQGCARVDCDGVPNVILGRVSENRVSSCFPVLAEAQDVSPV